MRPVDVSFFMVGGGVVLLTSKLKRTGCRLSVFVLTMAKLVRDIEGGGREGERERERKRGRLTSGDPLLLFFTPVSFFLSPGVF